VPPLSPEEHALNLHETFLEILRRLNQAEAEGMETSGLEARELARIMEKNGASYGEEIALDRAMGLLVDNGLVGSLNDPTYSWMRSRTIGMRFVITPLGKAYLLRQLEETGRIR
jgi:glycine cleavage system aminomethyltransferase T